LTASVVLLVLLLEEDTKAMFYMLELELDTPLTSSSYTLRLGLYHVDELDEEGFDVYFQGGLRSDDYFNAHDYWLNISRDESLSLSRSHVSNLKLSFEGDSQDDHLWLVLEDNKRKGAGTKKESQMCCRQIITKLARKARVLSDEVLRILSALIYCRDLDTTTQRELIDFEGRLIPEDPQLGVPRVSIFRPPRASLQD
nr:hypothetical protein [Tanacetum cinerariifolium]